MKEAGNQEFSLDMLILTWQVDILVLTEHLDSGIKISEERELIIKTELWGKNVENRIPQ